MFNSLLNISQGRLNSPGFSYLTNVLSNKSVCPFFRNYDPRIGRFIVLEPIGLNDRGDLYQYAPNPLGWIDLLGLTICSTKFKSRNAAFGAAKIAPWGDVMVILS